MTSFQASGPLKTSKTATSPAKRTTSNKKQFIVGTLLLIILVTGLTVGIIFGLNSTMSAANGQRYPYMSGVWIYDQEDISLIDSYTSQLSQFNKATPEDRRIENLNVYFATLEADLDQDRLNLSASGILQHRFEKYATVANIKGIMAVIDSSFDPASNDWTKLSIQSLKSAAVDTARTICRISPSIMGIALDLEPLDKNSRGSVAIFISSLEKALRSEETDCSKANDGQGMMLQVFCGSAVLGFGDVIAALGPNGILNLSGYDLQERDASTPQATTPAQFQSQLESLLRKAIESGVTFSVSIPAAATTQEFTSAKISSGSTNVTGNPMYSSSLPSYLKSAIDAVDAVARNKPTFRGITLWAMSKSITIKNVQFEPSNLFNNEGVAEYLFGTL